MADKLVKLDDILFTVRTEVHRQHNNGAPINKIHIIDMPMVMQAIQEVPAVDAVEVRHGKWEGDYPQATFQLKRCSVCETLAPEGWYCFFCGARMDRYREDG